MFSDECFITVQAGNGGAGSSSFRREKYVEYGGPDGGDGGTGGDIIFKVNNHLRNLNHIRSRPFIRAENGGNGSGKKKTGASGKDYIINVPLGTIIKNSETNLIIADLNKKDSICVVARGGLGGKGNIHFKSSIRKAPKYSQPGLLGEKKSLKIEIKTIADVGLVGFPNAGKSTLLSYVSNAKPCIANYPFTTVSPNIGVVYLKGYRNYIMADIPGLIEGAHLGVGLGIKFLKHIERTRVLIFVIDISENSPVDQFSMLLRELESYDKALLEKKYAIVLNKIDSVSLDTCDYQVDVFNDFIKNGSYDIYSTVFLISSLTGEGVDFFKYSLWDLI